MALEGTSFTVPYQESYHWLAEDDPIRDEYGEELPDEDGNQNGGWTPTDWADLSPEDKAEWNLLGTRRKGSQITQTTLKPSTFTELAFQYPDPKAESGSTPFTFEGRRHMRRIYDTPAQRILLCCGRQVEKSTLLGNRAITYSCLIPGFRTLYVSPSATQTKTFSNDRLKDAIETSPVLKGYTSAGLTKNIFEKQFVNRAKITLRYSFLNADRTRGIPAWALFIDELQDILYKNIPIMEQCTSHAPEEYQRFIYAGTPKTLDNTMESYRSKYSTMGEWCVPCDAHGGDTGMHWNILGEKNIGKKGTICDKCGKAINPQDPRAQWLATVALSKKVIFESYRIPQLMVPWKPWKSILFDYERYPTAQFYNEVLGISYESGMRPITLTELQSCSNELLSMSPVCLDKMRAIAQHNDVFMGIDWGYGQGSFTVVSIGMYLSGKFTIFFIHRCTGQEVEPRVQMELIKKLIKKYNVRLVGCDWGAGYMQNDELVRAFGPERVHKFYYMARSRKKIFVDTKLGIIKVHRTEVMSDIFRALKRKQIDFMRWSEFKEPFAQDIANIHAEYNETLRMIQYNHNPDRPDDSFHSIAYCLLISMLKYPRRDIVAPRREEPGQGPAGPGSTYTGPVFQG